MTTTTTVKQTLTYNDVYLMTTRDNGGRYHARPDTPAAEYIQENGYRTPSRAWPYSHSKPLLTKKFANWLKAKYPDIAKEFNLT